MNLGNNLFEARKKSGLSQDKVAEKLGITRQTISKWETNETTPIKVLVSHFSKDIQKSYTQGGVISDGKHFLGMACSEESALFFDKIQLPGKKALTIEECLRGFRLGNCNTLSFSKVMNMDNAN